MNKTLHTKIYKSISDKLESTPMKRSELVKSVCSSLGYNVCQLDIGSSTNSVRSDIGTAINEMIDSGLVKTDKNGLYYLFSSRPVIIRIEKCEREILKALTEAPHTKRELKNRLDQIFGADKTISRKDDDTISSFLGQLLKKLLKYGTIRIEEDKYLLSEKVSANADNVNEIVALKADFLLKLHSKGGEFFENFFMTLLSKYAKYEGKKVLECYVTGGSDDGGIDGVIKTEDTLGFRETTMIQTKNRLEIATETDVRGFYGAVCAKRGTRGIYATSSDFHPGAQRFLSTLDNCIGINGDGVFNMALKCSYGIKKQYKKFIIDNKIFDNRLFRK